MHKFGYVKAGSLKGMFPALFLFWTVAKHKSYRMISYMYIIFTWQNYNVKMNLRFSADVFCDMLEREMVEYETVFQYGRAMRAGRTLYGTDG